MASPANQSDLIDRSLRTLSTQELSVGGQLLSDAWNIIVAKVPGVQSRTDTSLIVQIQCAMVLRVLNNPDGKLEERGDDYSYRLDSSVSTGTLYISDAEADLLSANDVASVSSFTINPFGVRAKQPDTWQTIGSGAI